MRWFLGVSAAVALLLAAAATGTAAAVKRYDRHGVSFTYPAAWVVTTRPLSNVTNPRYRVTVSTAPVERTPRDEGPCLPGIAGQLPKDAVLMYVMEALGSDPDRLPSPDAAAPSELPSPGTLGQRLVRLQAVAVFGCPSSPVDAAFYLGIYVGPRAPSTAREQALHRLLDGMRIEPR